MLYPVYVHVGDADHAHGVTFPDFPGCFSAVDDWSDLPAAVQEAVEAHFSGEADAAPPPTPLELLMGQGAPHDPIRLFGQRGNTGHGDTVLTSSQTAHKLTGIPRSRIRSLACCTVYSPK